MSSRRQYAVFVGLVALVAATAFALGRRPHKRAEDLLAAAPSDAWLVVTFDVEALRTSVLAQSVIGSGGVTIPGLGKVSDACGFDPIARLAQVAVIAPEAGDRGDFGVAFAGDFAKDQLSRCAQKVIRARGGEPSTAPRGAFTVVADSTDPQRVRFAYRDGGPFLVGRGPWLDAMEDAVEGKTARARPEHLALRTALAAPQTGASGGPPPAIVLTALLPATVRDQLRAEVEPGNPNYAYAAVLGVQRAGFAVKTGAEGSMTDLTAQLECDSASACDEVKKLLERKRFALSQNVALRLLGLGPALDSFTVELRGRDLSVRAESPTDDLARLLRRVVGPLVGPTGVPTVGEGGAWTPLPDGGT